MSRISHVLDTSAILTHYFDEPGAELVERLWSDLANKPAVCAVSITELRSRLRDETTNEAEAHAALDAYLNQLTVCLPVDRAVAELAWQVRQSTPDRLPLVDSLIAATARAAGAILVHRDPHMAAIPDGVVRQLRLPEK